MVKSVAENTKLFNSVAQDMKILSYSVLVVRLVTLNIVGWQYCIDSLTNDSGGIDVDNNKFIVELTAFDSPANIWKGWW